ncbi:MAG TPA: ATP-binding protein [Candidatus Altiarchaeales archaeon]|nr:ATP-binding protein [Candidatus Altiarchaeales archaeon]
MRPFTTIAIPHRDIREGRLTMDVFAADLWEVYKSRAPEDYQNSEVFFRKTYLTSGLKNLLSIAEKRLKGKGGDPVIQLQTPFGGGKTHALIALYHKASEWKAKRVVIDGTALDPKDTSLWEEIERQLEGKVTKLKGRTSPGREKLRAVFEKHQPLMILLDELLEYAIKASGMEDHTLVTQTLTFIRELTDTVRTLEKSILILTYPSKTHYDEHGQRLLTQLQERSGRMEKIYTPVAEQEIYDVIKRRLFSTIDEKKAKDDIEEFLDYAEKEHILPEGVEKSAYRERFIKSYPFQPEVIDVLYKRWGSFPDFQRTRGVLRLLSLVVYSLRKSKNPFIRLADFDLENDDIRRELVQYIGPEFDSVIAADITSEDAGAKKVDKSLGDAYIPFSFGTKAATTIFLYSFSGGPERGATIGEVKLSTAEPQVPSSIVAEAVSKLSDNLFFLSDEGLFFTNKPNLNRMLLIKMENILDDQIREEERNLLTSDIKKEHFEIFLWPDNSRDIPDTKKLKLILQKTEDRKICKKFMEKCGERPRIYRNTLIFLCPMDSERARFEDFLKRKLAWQRIDGDRTLSLTPEQRKDVKERIKKAEGESKDYIRNLYRIVLLPSKEGLKDLDLGIPTYGADETIDKRVYGRLKSEDQIIERLGPLLLREKYLQDRDYVELKNIAESLFKTPGELRIVSEEVLKECVKEGVSQGLFGIGEIQEGKPVCRYFKADVSPEFVEGEILIKAELCEAVEKKVSEPELDEYIRKIKEVQDKESLDRLVEEIPWHRLFGEQEGQIQKEIEKKKSEFEPPPGDKYRSIDLRLNVVSGRLSDLVRIVNYIKSKFSRVNIKVEISARDGEMSVSEYQDRIEEAFNQANIDVEEKKME